MAVNLKTKGHNYSRSYGPTVLPAAYARLPARTGTVRATPVPEKSILLLFIVSKTRADFNDLSAGKCVHSVIMSPLKYF